MKNLSNILSSFSKRSNGRIFSALFIFPVLIFLTGGCSEYISTQKAVFADNLSRAISGHNDPETVRNGVPAYLLMIDAMILDDPENREMLKAGATLCNAYITAFVEDRERGKRLAEKSVRYAKRAFCLARQNECDLLSKDFDVFKEILLDTPPELLPELYTLGASLAAWIDVNRSSMNAVAQIPRVKAIMQRVVNMDETFENGSAHLYLGVLNTVIPPIMGGKPQAGRKHFQKAIKISRGNNLMAKVLFAKHYARMVFNRKLHDRLLREVIESKPDAPDLTLINALAKREAEKLLESADEYF